MKRGFTVLCLMGAAAAIVTAGAAAAQELRDCDWVASARNIAEPWGQNTREFANGAVRITKMDTIEPAAGSVFLTVLSPPYGELGDRQCKVIGWSHGVGFTELYFNDLLASYDPALGLIFQLPARIYDPEYAFSNSAILSFVVNQATGEINADVALGNE